MAVLRAVDLEKAFGDRVILRECTLTIEPGERLGLVGVNGSGKSTFLKIIAGELEPDGGRVERPGTFTLMEQEPALKGPTVEDAVQDAMAWHTALVEAYHTALEQDDLQEAGRLQTQLDDVGWDIRHQIDALMDRLDAPDSAAMVHTLSGGEIRRVALAQALLSSPDLLILDEPTNHLDAQTVDWLQGFLTGYRGAILLVTHDRYLLESVANRIIEIERGRTVSYDGSYADYLVERAERLAKAQQAHHRHVQMIAREAAWASRSPAARTGKQKARLNRLKALGEVEGFRQERVMQLDLSTGIKTGRSVLELHGVTKAYDGRVLFNNSDLNILAGDRIGILGPNGCGKSTLLSILSGSIEADAGELRKAPRFRVAVLNQRRVGLNLEDTVYEAAGGGNDHVTVADQSIHVASFLRRFLFDRSMFDQRVSTLSGGERARLLMARLLLEGCNLLLLDEPTNDLDLQTLRVLEEALLSFDGAMVVVTHDRAFLDRVCNRIVAFEDQQLVDYADRMQMVEAEQRREAERAQQRRLEKQQEKSVAPKKPTMKTSKRLSFNEKRELEAFPQRIEQLESDKESLEGVLADPETYRNRADEVGGLTEELAKLDQEIEVAYERWEDLMSRAEETNGA